MTTLHQTVVPALHQASVLTGVVLRVMENVKLCNVGVDPFYDFKED